MSKRGFVLETIFDSPLGPHWSFWKALLLGRKEMVKPSIFVQYVSHVFKWHPSLRPLIIAYLKIPLQIDAI